MDLLDYNRGLYMAWGQGGEDWQVGQQEKLIICTTPIMWNP